MRENKKQNQIKDYEKNPYHVFYDNYMETTSSDTECTGLIPAGDTDQLDLERYKDIFHFGGYE